MPRFVSSSGLMIDTLVKRRMLRYASSFVTAAYVKYVSCLRIRVPCLRPFYKGIR